MVKKDVVIAIDTGGTKGRVAAISLTEGILDERIFNMHEFASPEQPTAAAIVAADSILQNTGLAKGRLLGVSQASAGVHDKTTYTVPFSPNVPREILPLDMVCPVAEHLGVESKGIFNDCTSGAFAEWLYGWRPSQVMKGLPSSIRRNNVPNAYWMRRRNGVPEVFNDVVYVTVSSGENHGRIHNGQIDNGGYGTTPEGGHAPGDTHDLFENEIRCGCGGTGHIEGAVSMKGLARVVLNAYNSERIAGSNSERIAGSNSERIAGSNSERIAGSTLALAVRQLEDTTEDAEALLAAIPPVFYQCVKAGDEKALEINQWHNRQVARLISSLVCYLGPQIIAFGGSATRSMRYSMLPAFSEYRDNLGDNCYGGLQDMERQPALAVCRNYGDDHVLLGAAAGLFRQEFGDDVFARVRR